MRAVARYAVIGNPVGHSLSPGIHARFAQQTGVAIEYVRLLAPLDRFATVVSAFRRRGGRGANVTLPFKEQAFSLASERSARATAAGAANWLRFAPHGTSCDNTDGAGLVRDMRDNLGVALRGKRVLLIGAGGAARGVIAPLLFEQPESLCIVNRTEARAHALAGLFPGLKVTSFAGLAEQRFDIVINATSASLAGETLQLEGVFSSGMLAYDMMYGKAASGFLGQAAARGARTADGLGMLVEQAAESFFLWLGVRPRTAPVLEALRRER
jgi:shikimate dehydrogenase